MNYWQILGIQRTTDQRAIKKAYAKKSRLVHPEEHPEEFRELHDAYEFALNYAKNNASRYEPARSVQETQDADDLFGSLEDVLPEGVEEVRVIPPREENIFEALQNEEFEEEQVEEVQAIPPKKENMFEALQNEEERVEEPEPVEEPSEDENKVDIDFDEILEQDAINYFEDVMALTQKSLDELEKLYKGNVKKFKAWDEVCKSDYFCEAGLHPYFIDSITRFVKDRPDLPKNAYKALYDIYKFDELKTREDKGYLSELYSLFEERKHLKRKGKGVPSGVMGGIGAAILAVVNVGRSDGDFFTVIGIAVFVLFVIGVVGGLIYFIVSTIKEEKKKSPEIKELEKKRKEAYKKEINPSWNPYLHIKRNQYYSKGVVLAFNALLLMSVFWINNYDDDTSIMLGVLSMIVAASGIVFLLFTNLFVLIGSRTKNAEAVSLSNKKSFRVVIGINIWVFLLNVYSMFEEDYNGTFMDVFAFLLFGVPIAFIVIYGIMDDIKKKKAKKNGEEE